MKLVLSQESSKYLWSTGIAVGLYVLAAPLVLLVVSCAFLLFHISDLTEYMGVKKVWPFWMVGIVGIMCAVALSYDISLLANFQELNGKFLYWLLYGPMLIVLFAAGFVVQQKFASLMLDAAVLVFALQLAFIIFSRDALLVREFSVGLMIFLPVALFSKQTGWKKMLLVLLVLSSGVVTAFSEQRSLLVALLFELVLFNVVAFGKRSLYLTACFILGFLTGGILYVQSVQDGAMHVAHDANFGMEANVEAVTGITKKPFAIGVTAISKRVGDGDPSQFMSYAGHLLLNYSDRLELNAATFDMVSSHSIFGYSKQIPFEQVIMNSGAKLVEQYKSINYVPSHPHNFMMRAYYDLGVLSVLYAALFVLLLFYFGVSGLALSLLTVYGIYGLVESPTPFYLFFLTGVLMADSFRKPRQF